MSVFFEQWKYCPRCGAEGAVALREGDNPSFTCSVCPLQTFDSPWVGTIALIENKAGELLLLQRAIDPAVGMWDLPGGFLSGGEKLDVCVAREVKEELDLELTNITYVGNAPSDYGGHPSLSVIFKGETSGEPTLSDENLAFRWWSPEGEIPLLAFQDVTYALTLWRLERLTKGA